MASPKEMFEQLKAKGGALGTKVKDNAKAGIDVAGSVIKTAGKRVIGDDSPTTLKPETKKTLGIK